MVWIKCLAKQLHLRDRRDKKTLTPFFFLFFLLCLCRRSFVDYSSPCPASADALGHTPAIAPWLRADESSSGSGHALRLRWRLHPTTGGGRALRVELRAPAPRRRPRLGSTPASRASAVGAPCDSCGGRAHALFFSFYFFPSSPHEFFLPLLIRTPACCGPTATPAVPCTPAAVTSRKRAPTAAHAPATVILLAALSPAPLTAAAVDL
jgi:hypothetical protein